MLNDDVPLCRCRTLGFWRWLDFYSGSLGWSCASCFLGCFPSASISAVRTVLALRATCTQIAQTNEPTVSIDNTVLVDVETSQLCCADLFATKSRAS